MPAPLRTSPVAPRPLHIVFVMANNTTAPYFTWFAQAACAEPRVRMTFVALTEESPQMKEDVGRYGWACHWIPFRQSHRKTDMLRAVPRLVRLFGKLRPDIVQTHLFDDSLPGLLAARLAGVPLRMITKGDTGYHWRYTPRWMWFDKLNNANATHVLALSTESREFILQHEQAPPEKVHVMPHGIPEWRIGQVQPEAQARLADRLHTHGRKVVGIISRYIEWKGYGQLIPAFARLQREVPEAYLLITGYGTPVQTQAVQQLLADNGLTENEACITGWVDPLEVPSLFALMDVYVHAATLEPFGLVIAEAMFFARPLVSTRTGCASDAVTHLQTGYLCKPGSIEELYEGMKWCIDNPTEARAMGQRAQEYARKELTFDRCFQRHLDLWLGAARERRLIP